MVLASTPGGTIVTHILTADGPMLWLVQPGRPPLGLPCLTLHAQGPATYDGPGSLFTREMMVARRTLAAAGPDAPDTFEWWLDDAVRVLMEDATTSLP